MANSPASTASSCCPALARHVCWLLLHLLLERTRGQDLLLSQLHEMLVLVPVLDGVYVALRVLPEQVSVDQPVEVALEGAHVRLLLPMVLELPLHLRDLGQLARDLPLALGLQTLLLFDRGLGASALR